MRVLTLMNEKGGVGKTTLAVHIAAGLAIAGLRVVLIDADSQGHATETLGVSKRPHMHDFVVRNARWDDVITPVADERFHTETLHQGEFWLLPGDIETRSIPTHISNPFVLRDRINEINDLIDVVVFDTAPTPSLLHGSIYLATDVVIYPVKPAALDMAGLVSSIGHHNSMAHHRTMNNLGDIRIGGIVPTMYREGVNAHDFGLKKLRERYGRAVWGPLPLRTVWEQAAFARKTVFAYAPDSDAAQHAMLVVGRAGKALVA